MTKFLAFAGFVLSSIVGLCFLILFLMAICYIPEPGALRAALFDGFVFVTSAAVAVCCHLIPGKKGLVE